jgi:peptide/nickel transport system substrate-binding protein
VPVDPRTCPTRAPASHVVAFRLLAAVLAVGLAGGCACDRAARPAGEALVIIDSPPASLDRRYALAAVADRVTSLISPGLLRIGDDGQPEPDLAESFERVGETRYRFVLRDGLTFHDGTPLTSADVVYTFESLERLGSPLTPRYARIASIEAVDPSTVDIVLTEPFAPLLIDLTLGIVPAHAGDDPGFGSRPIGAGPFRFEARPSQERLVLAAFDAYYGGRPQIDRLVFAVVRDETTRVLSMLHGDADLVSGGISPILIPRLESEDHLSVQRRPGMAYAYMTLNLRHPILSDVRVRQAIAHAIDREAIVEHKLRGAGTLATGMLPATHWSYGPATAYDHDPDRARALLDAAGYPDPGDGRPRFRITYKTSNDRFRRSVALVLASQLEAVGIAVDLRSYEWGTFFGDIREGRYEIATVMWTPGSLIDPNILHWVFHSDSIPGTYVDEDGGTRRRDGANRGGYVNAEVDGLLDEAAVLLDPEERIVRYARVQEILGEELPYVSLWHEETVLVVGERLEGYVASPFGHLHPLANARIR